MDFVNARHGSRPAIHKLANGAQFSRVPGKGSMPYPWLCAAYKSDSLSSDVNRGDNLKQLLKRGWGSAL